MENIIIIINKKKKKRKIIRNLIIYIRAYFPQIFPQNHRSIEKRGFDR